MRILFITIMIGFTSTCYAGQEWGFISNVNNGVYEIKEISIERISSTIVRALTRFKRNGRIMDTDYKSLADYPNNVRSCELVMDFDCTKSRYKIIQEVRIIEYDKRTLTNIEPVQTFEKITPGSIFDGARTFACKSEGMLKNK